MSTYIKEGKPLDYDNAPDWLVAYLQYQRSVLGCTEKTAITYLIALRRFFQWYSHYARTGRHPRSEQKLRAIDILPLPLEVATAVTRADVEAYLYFCTDVLKNAPATRNKKLVAIRTFYDYLLDQKDVAGAALQINPADRIHRAKTGKNEPVFLQRNEQRAFLEGISGENGVRDYAIFLLLLSAGLRVSEAVGLNKSDLNLEAMTIRVRGKGNKERICVITEPCRDAIERYVMEYRALIPGLQTDALFVSSRRRERLTTRMVQKAMQKYLIEAKLGGNGYTPHKLRHTTATTLVKDGADLLTVQKLLGHESSATTGIYAHLDDSDVTKALEQSSLAKLGEL